MNRPSPYSASHPSVASLDPGFRAKYRTVHLGQIDAGQVRETLTRDPDGFQRFMRRNYGGNIMLGASTLGACFTAVTLVA